VKSIEHIVAPTSSPVRDDDPLIVLIGGTAGCGKTTLANHIVARLDLDHRLGTGFIRAIVQSQTDQAVEPTLFRRTYESNDPVGNVYAQSLRLRPAVQACIDRAKAEGTSLVIEGTHLLPELYHDLGEPFIVLEHPEPDEHRHRLVGHRHLRRTVSSEDAQRAREIGSYFVAEARVYGIPTNIYADNLEEILRILLKGRGQV